MKWGPKAGEKKSTGEFLARLAEETGQRSTAVETYPKLDVIEARYWEAFQLLHASRQQTGFGPGAIPLSEMMVYAELMGMNTEDRLELIQILRAMDRVYIEQASKK